MKDWGKAALAAVIISPLAILLHEAGHYLFYVAGGLPSPHLAYNYGGFAGMSEFWSLLRDGNAVAAEAIAPIGMNGWAAMAGLAITNLIGLFGIVLARRGRWVGASLAIGSLWRIALIGLLFLLGDPVHTDESHIGLVFGFPGVILVFSQLAIFIWALVVVQRKYGWKTLAAVLAGTLVGGFLWNGPIGPVILP